MSLDLGPHPDADGYGEALELDRNDPLAGFRDRFVIDDPEIVYLDGNSLGRLPRRTPGLVREVVERQWGRGLIRSWNDGWWELQLEIGDQLSPLIGASPGTVIISDSTSVNLHKLATAAVEGAPGRSKIVTDDLNFPSDVYVLAGIAETLGLELEVVSTGDNATAEQSVIAAIDEDTALVSLSHTAFKSGFTYDMTAVTSATHASGARVLWDLSHSVGAFPVDLESAGADLAVGCTYKYLNGGPGSPAFLFVRQDLQEELNNPIPAWWAHARPFDFDLDFEPASGIRRFHTGTTPILSLAPVAAGIADVADAGIDAIREKSIGLGEYLLRQWREHLVPLGFGLGSPLDPERRGSHVALTHDEAWPIARAMIELGKVIPDFRAPDSLRLGLAPLYVSYLDVHTAVQRMKEIVSTGAHTRYEGATSAVT